MTDSASVPRKDEKAGDGGSFSRETVTSVRSRLDQLLEINVALSSVHDLDQLLDLILEKARGMTFSDAGSIYLVEDENLIFRVTQNKTLEERLGKNEFKSMFAPFPLPMSKESLAGYVTITGETLNIEDVYHIPEEKEYHFDTSWDERNYYRTQSVLVTPLIDQDEKIIGVLQLINATGMGKPVPFNKPAEKLIRALGSQAAVAIQNARLTMAIRQAHHDTILRLSAAAGFRDKETANHINRISAYCELIARDLGWEHNRIELIKWASPMHDIGKLGIPDRILQKPGKLTEEEYEGMQRHTTIGALIMEGAEGALMELGRIIALSHHEKWNGKGYPNGLADKDIPVEGRVTAIADVFDALSSSRCYKPAFPQEKVLAILQEERGLAFDPDLLDVFIKNMDGVLEIKSQYTDTEEDFKKLEF